MSSPHNWLLLLSYNGTNYHGWQVQPNSASIEGTLEQAISQLTGERVKVHGAGRTDAGVHALNYTANFTSQTSKINSAEKWQKALNAVLADDIAVKGVQEVALDFHARHDAIGKRYRYLINNLSFQSPFSIHQSWWIRQKLDIPKMNAAAEILLGEHDFSAFRSSNCSSPHPTKNLKEISILVQRSRFATLQIDLEANSFLQHMVRIIVGTLVEVGLGKMKIGEVENALKSKNRQKAGRTAPAHGLYAMNIIYPPNSVKWCSDAIDE